MENSWRNWNHLCSQLQEGRRSVHALLHTISLPERLSELHEMVFLWYSASTAEPFLQMYRSSQICMLLLDYDSVFQGSKVKIEPSTLIKFASCSFLWRLRSHESSGWRRLHELWRVEELTWECWGKETYLKWERQESVCRNPSSSW